MATDFNRFATNPMARFRRLLLPALATSACVQPLNLARDDSPTLLAGQSLTAPNPAAPGSFKVRLLYYGSGNDKRRAEYRDSVTLRTKSVDASKLVNAPKALAKSREKYWGFGFDSLPINGRVWYPEGDGPFPLVLIVHGNHDMKEFSDPGYGYLGQHLASHGYILASVDENFLNGNLRQDNDARGWLLLKHLEAWRGFNDSAGSPLEGKVDLGNIGLMGHSRGGEAITEAAAFNRLRYYPDDATVRFDFNFAIKALVAIAPIDGQYDPAQRPTPLENVNYLVIHGSHDGDVTAFSGLRQYQRVRFTDGKRWFKSAIWMWRANHGQWNTVWGAKDNGPTSGRVLNLRGLIDGESQRRFAVVVMTAFLEATLEGRREYLPLFRDHRVAGAWLPTTMYWTRFEDSGFRPLARFGEDIDVTTGSAPGVRLDGDSLATWREGQVPLRWRDVRNLPDGKRVGHGAVWLGWNNKIAGRDSTKRGRPAAFSVRVPDSLRTAWGVGSGTAVVLSLSPVDSTPDPRRPKADSTKSGTATTRADQSEPKPPRRFTKDTLPIDLSVEAVDQAGVSARVLLSRYGPVRRPPEIIVLRRKGADKRSNVSLTELVLQTYVIPLTDFTKAEVRFNPARLTVVRLVFDRADAGTIVLSDVGLSNIDPAFYVAHP